MAQLGAGLEAAKASQRKKAQEIACAIARGLCFLKADEDCTVPAVCQLDINSGCPPTVTYEDEGGGDKMRVDLKDHIDVLREQHNTVSKQLIPQKNRYSGRHYYGQDNAATQQYKTESAALQYMIDVYNSGNSAQHKDVYKNSWIYICECIASDSGLRA